MRITELLFTLLVSVMLSSCATAPENNQPTKGQMISKCLDNDSPEQCDKKYNP